MFVEKERGRKGERERVCLHDNHVRNNVALYFEKFHIQMTICQNVPCSQGSAKTIKNAVICIPDQ